MNVKLVTSIILLSVLSLNCTKEYDCLNLPIQPAFIGFASSDIDTFVLRKFKANDSYQNLIDTFIVNGNYSSFNTSNDTTTVFINDATNDGKAGILVGFDWQIFIPSKNKTVLISDISSEMKTGKRGYGIFNVDHVSSCTNHIFSAKVDNQIINFPNSDTTRHYLYITN
jgi:hypothetical protein